MATDKISVPKPGEGEPIVFFDITLGGKCPPYLNSWAVNQNRETHNCYIATRQEPMFERKSPFNFEIVKMSEEAASLPQACVPIPRNSTSSSLHYLMIFPIPSALLLLSS